MIKSISVAALGLAAFAGVAAAYEYPLQFTPNPGYRGLVVAGYRFEGNVVVGNCSYSTVSGSKGGKGGGSGSVAKRYMQTCRWDLYGNLLSITPGAPAVPAPLYKNGTQVVYAVNANGDYAGSDTKLPDRGFVFTPGSHYTWLTPNSNAVIQQMVQSHVLTLKSDGDVSVNIASVTASALRGAVTVNSTTCVGQIRPGETCVVKLSYDPTRLASPDGVVSDTLHVDVTSDAGASHDFVQPLTIVLPQKL